MHILMLVSNAAAYDSRVMNEARSLVSGGHRVTVVAWDRGAAFAPEEKDDGLRILRVRNTAYMNLLPLDLLRLRPWWRLAVRRSEALHRRDPFQAVHCHDLDTLPAGVRLKRRLHIPLVYDAHEIWGYMVSRDVPDVVANHFLRKERRLVPQADAVVTVCEPLKSYFEKLTEVPVRLVLNAKPIVTSQYVPPAEDSFRVVYIGTLNRARLIHGLISAIRQLPGTELLLGGIGKPAFVKGVEEAAEAVPRITFVGLVPQDEVVPLTMTCHAVACLTDPADRNNSIALANKVFEAMVSGRPVIVSKGTYLSQFVEEHGVGMTVEHSEEGVRQGLQILRDEPALRESLGRRALEKAVHDFNWEAQERDLLRVYEELVP